MLEAISTSYERHPVGLGGERFEILCELGRGGFGVVYEAIDHGLPGSPCVALKRLSGAHPERLHHFKREFRSLAEMRHRNLVQLYELVARVRTETLFRMRAPESQRRTLRQTLPLEDQTLLVLRVERELSFRDLAVVMNADAALTEDALEREAARLRKRYQLVKTRLHELIRTNESAD